VSDKENSPDPAPHRQQGKKARMAPRSDAPPGLEQDGCGNTIPLAERTAEGQRKARAAQHKI